MVVVSETDVLDMIDLLGGMLFDVESLLDLLTEEGTETVEWDFESRKSQLERATRFVFALHCPVACYPVSVAAVVTLDGTLCP